jgi:hypothetical protein
LRKKVYQQLKNIIMKKFIVILLFAFGCSEEEETLMGCQTGIRDGYRQLMRCSTQQENLAGDNERMGGVKFYTGYKDVEWEKCDQCQ